MSKILPVVRIMIAGAITLVAAHAQQPPPPAVGVCDIVSNPAVYDGKRVLLSGYLDGGLMEGLAITQDAKWTACPNRGIWWPSALSVSLGPQMPASLVRLIGRDRLVMATKITASVIIHVKPRPLLDWLISSMRRGHADLPPIRLEALDVLSTGQ